MALACESTASIEIPDTTTITFWVSMDNVNGIPRITAAPRCVSTPLQQRHADRQRGVVIGEVAAMASAPSTSRPLAPVSVVTCTTAPTTKIKATVLKIPPRTALCKQRRS